MGDNRKILNEQTKGLVLEPLCKRTESEFLIVFKNYLGINANSMGKTSVSDHGRTTETLKRMGAVLVDL